MKIKKIIQIIILSLLLYSCGSGLKDALQGKKRSENSDEFLVHKKNPLILPPNYDELPVPSTGLENQEIINEEDSLEKQEVSVNITNENDHVFENPIQVDPLDENRLRRENLKKYNYVFNDGNSSVEDLEKEPAYKRMGVQINSNINNEQVESKPVLNENNEIEFPEPNSYLHDNVD